MDLEKSYGVLASSLERTWCNRVQLRSNTRSRIERKPSQPASYAVALADPMIPSLPTLHHGSYVRSNARITIDRIHHCDRTHSLRSNAALRPGNISFCINRTLSVYFEVTFLRAHPEARNPCFGSALLL
jgi:hypothetical protein